MARTIDLDAFGASAEEAGNDPDLQPLQMRVLDATSVTIVNQSIAGGHPDRSHGREGAGTVVEVYVSKPLPGKYAKAAEEGIAACDVVESAGAMNAGIGTINFSGPGQG